jgi:predicted DNA-binding transcriptional regulator AlpA
MTLASPERKIRNLEDLPELVTRAELSQFSGVAVQTLARWAVDGTGPRITKLNRAVRYRRADVVAWLDAQGA